MTPARRLTLLVQWTRVRLLIWLRTPRAAFFTFVFPLLLLVLLNSVNGGVDVTCTTTGEQVSFATYFTPSIGVFALITGCYTGIIFAVSTARDRGIIKRVVGTPLPPASSSPRGRARRSSPASAPCCSCRGRDVFFGVSIEPQLIPAAVVAVLLGGLCMSSLGLAVASFIRKAESAPAVSNITMFPLIFLSGVFFPIGDAPQWIQDVANIFPVAHLVDAFTGCFDPATTGSGFTSDYWSLVIWTGDRPVRRLAPLPRRDDRGGRRPPPAGQRLGRRDQRGHQVDRLLVATAPARAPASARCRRRARGRSPRACALRRAPADRQQQLGDVVQIRDRALLHLVRDRRHRRDVAVQLLEHRLGPLVPAVDLARAPRAGARPGPRSPSTGSGRGAGCSAIQWRSTPRPARPRRGSGGRRSPAARRPRSAIALTSSAPARPARAGSSSPR